MVNSVLLALLLLVFSPARPALAAEVVGMEDMREKKPVAEEAKPESSKSTVRPYVGVGYQFIYRPGDGVAYNNPSEGISGRPAGMHAFNGLAFPILGLKFGDYLGAEVGFLTTLWSSSQIITAAPGQTLQLRSLIYGPTLDFMGYYPMADGSPFDLVGVTGFAFQFVTAQAMASGTKTYKETHSRMGVGMRMGGGVAYHVNEHVDFRALAQFQLMSHRFGDAMPGNFSGSGLWVFSLSAVYIF